MEIINRPTRVISDDRTRSLSATRLVRRALRPGPAATWGPFLVAIYGIGLLLGAVFRPGRGRACPRP